MFFDRAGTPFPDPVCFFRGSGSLSVRGRRVHCRFPGNGDDFLGEALRQQFPQLMTVFRFDTRSPEFRACLVIDRLLDAYLSSPRDSASRLSYLFSRGLQEYSCSVFLSRTVLMLLVEKVP